MENWVLDELVKIRKYGKFTKNEIKKLKIVEGTTPKGEKARYVDVCIDVITKNERLRNTTINSPYSTVEYDKDKEITSIKIWFHKEKNEFKIYRIQLPKITPHICRHTFCSNMAKSGMNPKTLQYLMGHSDIGVTLNTYTHLGEEDAKEEMEKMGLLKTDTGKKIRIC